MFNSLEEIPLELSPGVTGGGAPKPDIPPEEPAESLCRKHTHLRRALFPNIHSAARLRRRRARAYPHGPSARPGHKPKEKGAAELCAAAGHDPKGRPCTQSSHILREKGCAVA